VRQDINDAIYAALDGSTSVNYVSRDYDAWWEWGPDRYPGVCMIPGEAEISRLAYPHATASDMEAIYPMSVQGYTEQIGTSSRADEQKSALLAAIEDAVSNSTAVDDATCDVVMIGADEENGGLADNWHGIVTGNFMITYHYNHLSP